MYRMSHINFLCVNSFFSENFTKFADFEFCFFDQNIFLQLQNFNATDCISNISSFSQNLNYPCVFYYLNIYNNTDSNTCVQFYYISENIFETHSCYTFGDELAQLFSVNHDILEITISILFVFFFVYYEFFYSTAG
jgi:hypothetical protein